MKKRALITGGASDIGEAISRLLGKKGIDLIILYNTNKEKAFDLKKQLEKENSISVDVLKCDLKDEEDINKVYDFVKEKYNTIDYLVNNAALCIDSLYSEKTKENFMKTLEVNLVGTFLISRLFGDLMYEYKKGSIVNLSSTNGINKNFPMSLDYDASKAGLNSLTHNLSLEYSPYVRVNAVAPGFIGTKKELMDLDEEYIKSEEEKVYLKRYGKAEEVAEVVYFLLSDKSSYINNEIIKVDGGMY